MRQPRRILLATALGVAALKGALVWSGWPETSLIADDAYYYFTIARNLAAGLGPTFDTLAPTNGFHPLWQLLLVPVWAIWPQDLWLAVRAAMSLSVALDLVSAVVVFGLLRRHGEEGLASVGAAVWLLNPLTFFLGLRGMEASVSTLCILMTLRAVARSTGDWKSALRVGIWIGLCGWARTDNLLTVGAAVAGATLWPVQDGTSRAARTRWVAVSALASGVIVLPWFVWSYTRFGQLIQVSGQVKRVTTRIVGHLPTDYGSPIAALESALHAVMAPVLVPTRWLSGDQFTSGRAYLWLSILILVALVMVMHRSRAALLRGTCARFSVIYLTVHTLVFGMLWGSYATWYALPWFAVLTVWLLGAAARTHDRWNPPARVGALVLGSMISVVLLAAYVLRVDHGARGPETRFRPLLEESRSMLPDGGVLGAFDAGAVGYVAGEFPDLRVVNLDCLVNNAAYEALRHDRYGDYVAQTVDLFLQSPTRARMFLDEAQYASMMQRFEEKIRQRGSAQPSN